MRKFLRKFVGIILIFVLLISLNGCRKKTSEEGEGEVGSAEKIELVWWHLFDPCDTFKGPIQEFESINKNVKIKCEKFTDPDKFEELLINELAQGEGPDIFSIKNTKIYEHQKKIFPIPASIMIPQEFRDTFFAVASDDLILSDEEDFEQIYALPLDIDNLAIYYNKSLFRDNIASSDKPGITWEEIKEQVYALTKKDNSIERFAITGIAMGRADNILRAVDILQLLLLQYETQMVDEQGKKAVFALQQGTQQGTGKPYYPGIEALSLYTSFALPSYKNYSWNQLITSRAGDSKEIGVFVRGKVAMIFGYAWLYEEIKLQIQAAQKNGETHINIDEVGIAPVPQLTNPAESGKQDAFASYYPLTVSRNSENADLAWQFVKFLTRPENLQDYHKQTHKPTPRKDMVEEQITEMLFGVFARQASSAKSIRTYDDHVFANIFIEAINAVSKAAKKTSQEAMQQAQRRMTCLLEKIQKPTLDKNCEEIE